MLMQIKHNTYKSYLCKVSEYKWINEENSDA